MGAAAIGSVGMGASLAGGIVSAAGNIMQGNAQQKMYNYQAQVATINANIDKQNAEWSLAQGETEALQAGLKGGQQFGAIRAAQGASNLDVNSGSAREVQNSQRTLTAMDLAQIRLNAGKTAYDYEVKATADTNQAALDVEAGKQAKTAGEIGAISSILGSTSSVSSKWLQGQQAGMFSSGPGPGFVSGL